MPLDPGTRVGVYEIGALVGAGAAGEVYKATDTREGRTVAIRILSPELAGDEGRIDRLDEETRKLAALNHPHVCLFHETGHEGDLRFFVTEYVDGQSLEARLKDGALPLDEAL